MRCWRRRRAPGEHLLPRQLRCGEDRDVAERDQLLDYIGVVTLDPSILIDAEAIVPTIKTLDAIHLASATRAGVDDLVVATHDVQMFAVASAMGFAAVDPVVDDPNCAALTG